MPQSRRMSAGKTCVCVHHEAEDEEGHLGKEIRPVMLLGEERLQGQADDDNRQCEQQNCPASVAEPGKAADEGLPGWAFQPE